MRRPAALSQPTVVLGTLQTLGVGKREASNRGWRLLLGTDSPYGHAGQSGGVVPIQAPSEPQGRILCSRRVSWWGERFVLGEQCLCCEKGLLRHGERLPSLGEGCRRAA